MAEPKLRFKRDDGSSYPAWKEYAMDDILTERNEPHRITEDAPQLSFTIEQGVIYPEDKKTNKRDFLMKDKDNKKFLLTEYNDIIYNPANLKFGAIHRNTLGRGVVSPIYAIFTTNQNPEFIEGVVTNPAFIKRSLKYLEGTVEKLKTLKPRDFVKMRVWIPCLEEQQKIADFLSSVDEVISVSEAEVANLETQKKAVMKKIFSREVRFKREDGSEFPAWGKKCIGDICKTYSGGTPKAGNDAYYGGNIPFIRSGEIHGDSTELFLSEAGMKNSSAKMIAVGDIIMALYGATSGEIDISKIEGAINQAILCIKPDKAFNKKYIVEVFRNYKDDILKTYLQGGQGNLSAQIVQSLSFDFPCLEEQRLIADFLSSFDEAIAAAKEELELWKVLKKGLLQQMFV